MSIYEIIRDEADEKRYKSREESGYHYYCQPQTMSLKEVRALIGVDDGLIKTNKQFPQIVDLDEF